MDMTLAFNGYDNPTPTNGHDVRPLMDAPLRPPMDTTLPID
jgi:hypothetical protein